MRQATALFLLLAWLMFLAPGQAVAAADPCPRAAPGSAVPEPHELRSHDGVLRVDLIARNVKGADGQARYCYLLADGTLSPTLRLAPGDELILHLHNELTDLGPLPNVPAPTHVHAATGKGDPCASGAMTATSTNLHFHGLTLPPLCHQDEVVRTSVQPHEPPFEYRFRIPADESPGLYWYHPHIHGFSSIEVAGGASGALIVEGLERSNPAVRGLAERVLIIRDQALVNPDAPPSKSEPVVPKFMIDRDGDAANNGTGFGKPAKDLSINYVPVPYPDYPPATLKMRPEEKQLWRVLNASSVTYLNLALLFQRAPQQLGIVAIDGVPINAAAADAPPVQWADHIGIPPGGRVEFIVTAPPQGVPGLLVTRTVDTGQGGENDPNRALASLTTMPDAGEPIATLPSSAPPSPPAVRPWLGSVAPVRVRRLYFSEKLSDPNNPNSATEFFITVDGEKPAAFDPASKVPNIIVHQGDVEDWIIENRSTELHAFHIHQTHFLLLGWSGVAVNEPFLRDTVNVPYYNVLSFTYPSVRLRMDFRDPAIIGTFLYHCHLLEHEDGGMMGLIRVEPAAGTFSAASDDNACCAHSNR
jgi:FtsP/CotA-like multicopper oxidase with cupredoxin domain